MIKHMYCKNPFHQLFFTKLFIFFLNSHFYLFIFLATYGQVKYNQFNFKINLKLCYLCDRIYAPYNIESSQVVGLEMIEK